MAQDRQHTERLKAMFGAAFNQKNAAELAAKVKNPKLAERICEQMKLGDELKVWAVVGIKKQPRERSARSYVMKMIRRDPHDQSAGLMPWFLTYEETGELPKNEVAPTRPKYEPVPPPTEEMRLAEVRKKFDGLPALKKIDFLERAEHYYESDAQRRKFIDNLGPEARDRMVEALALTYFREALNGQRKRAETSEKIRIESDSREGARLPEMGADVEAA